MTIGAELFDSVSPCNPDFELTACRVFVNRLVGQTGRLHRLQSLVRMGEVEQNMFISSTSGTVQ